MQQSRDQVLKLHIFIPMRRSNVRYSRGLAMKQLDVEQERFKKFTKFSINSRKQGCVPSAPPYNLQNTPGAPFSQRAKFWRKFATVYQNPGYQNPNNLLIIFCPKKLSFIKSAVP